MPDPIQSLCEQGQAALLATDYLAAERHLVAAEELAWDADHFDALARLYMPLQEARRQRRQTCGDGVFASVIARSPSDEIDADALAERHPRGQLIVAGFGSIGPAANLRAIAAQRGLYLDLPLAAAYDVGGQATVLIVPTADVAPPPAEKVGSIDALLRLAPPHSVVVPAAALPPDQPRGDSATFGYAMSLWETLHGPFLGLADSTMDPRQKLIAYRQTIRVDYACEFAHQRFSQTARLLSRRR
ncbi:MAG TPA: hypothetical protein VF595_00795 [Tepidisphaeraceae bacterium]|jgi:hypothetical protein